MVSGRVWRVWRRKYTFPLYPALCVVTQQKKKYCHIYVPYVTPIFWGYLFVPLELLQGHIFNYIDSLPIPYLNIFIAINISILCSS
jgi:hypothetical protein